jgi:hypothetical protein
MTSTAYQTVPYIFSSKGLVQRYAIDRMADHTLWNHDYAECRQENSVGSALGRHAITQNGVSNVPVSNLGVYQLAWLKGLAGNSFRYAAGTALVGGKLYRRFGLSDGAYSPVALNLSGGYFSASQYNPQNTGLPYIFFGDLAGMLKDDGSFGVGLQLWGIMPPYGVPVATVIPFEDLIIEGFTTTGGLGSSGFSGPLSIVPILNTTLGTIISSAPGEFTVTPGNMTNIIPFAHLTVGSETDVIVQSTTPSSFTALFNSNHAATDVVSNSGVQGVVPAATSDAWISRAGPFDLSKYASGAPVGSSDFINIGLQCDLPFLVSATIQFDVGDGSFTQSYYTATIPTSQISGAYTAIATQIGSFQAIGQAGLAGHTWANVNAWRIVFDNTDSTDPATVTVSDFYIYGGSGPDVSGGGSPYDYRITYYNINTGNESAPSAVFVTQNEVSPVRQAVSVSWIGSIDPQVTHVRVYRRGGTLTAQWLQVAQVPIGTTTFIDTLSDSQIAANNILNIDTAPPVTSTLTVPVNTTLTANVSPGFNSASVASSANIFINQYITIDALTPNEETVFCASASPGAFVADFQLPHTAGATVQASTVTGFPVNIGTIAFDRAWLAGDPNNPNVLYYSDRFNPESFPLENFLEIGVPSDPIMGIAEWNGQLYVLTQNTVWNILGAQGGTVPLPYKTAAKHGLAAPLGFVVTEGEIWYQSYGGIYKFQGSVSVYASEQIEPVFTAQFIDDTVNRPVPLMDPNKISNTLMAFYQNEVYISYVGLDGKRHRVIYHKIYNRWRNDDAAANGMIVEEESSYRLLYGDLTGMVYQDRTGNFLDAGFSGSTQQFAPMGFNVQTACMDMGMPKNFKNFNELTLDIDTAGINVTVTLWFNHGQLAVPIATINSGTRNQISLEVNGGLGQLSLDVSLQLTATVQSAIASPVTVYEAHIRFEPEAELRMSYDSYLMDFGTPDYKIIKQFYVEYQALDSTGITFQCYIEGAPTPVFSFTVPQALVRSSFRCRVQATKAKIWRIVGTSPQPFRIYSDSRSEVKRVTQDLGYQIIPLQQPAATQP